MKELDPGHYFELYELDADKRSVAGKIFVLPHLTFVKREGEKYPGNFGHYPGTNLQEVYRAAIARHKYLDKQEPHSCNQLAIDNLRANIIALETRAAERHLRPEPVFTDEVETMPFCGKCGHIGCTGGCESVCR